MKGFVLLLILNFISACNSIDLKNATSFPTPSPTVDDRTAYFASQRIWEEYGLLCGIDKAGKARCWGFHFLNTLNGEYLGAPTEIGLDGASSIHADVDAVCLIKDGAVYCMGSNPNGELGLGSTDPKSIPTLIPSLSSGVTSMDIVADTACAIKDGAVFCWGSNYHRIIHSDNVTYPSFSSPIPIPSLGSGVTEVTLGVNRACALKNGGVYCWGRQHEGELGDGNHDSHESTPVAVIGLESGVTKIWSNIGHYASPGDSTCALKNGDLFCWGNNDFGQLGFSTTTSRDIPELHPLSGKGVKDVHLMGMAGCILTFSSEVWCWGYNLNAAGFMDPNVGTIAHAVKMTSVPEGVIKVFGPGTWICYQTKAGAKCQGQNEAYQIDDTKTSYTVPTPLRYLAP